MNWGSDSERQFFEMRCYPIGSQRPSDICKCHDSFMIIMLPLDSVDWQAPSRPMPPVAARPKSVCNVWVSGR